MNFSFCCLDGNKLDFFFNLPVVLFCSRWILIPASELRLVSGPSSSRPGRGREGRFYILWWCRSVWTAAEKKNSRSPSENSLRTFNTKIHRKDLLVCWFNQHVTEKAFEVLQVVFPSSPQPCPLTRTRFLTHHHRQTKVKPLEMAKSQQKALKFKLVGLPVGLRKWLQEGFWYILVCLHSTKFHTCTYSDSHMCKTHKKYFKFFKNE